LPLRILFLTILGILFYSLSAKGDAVTNTTRHKSGDLFSLQYGNLLIPFAYNKLIRSEGLLIRFITPWKKTHITGGFFASSQKITTSQKQDIGVTVGIPITGKDGETITFDMPISIDGMEYAYRRDVSYMDVLLSLSQSVYSKHGYIGKRREYYNSYVLDIYGSAGFRYGIISSTYSYTVYKDNTIIGRADIPLGGAKNTGILFTFGGGISFRLSYIITTVDINATWPLTQSFVHFGIGGSL